MKLFRTIVSVLLLAALLAAAVLAVPSAVVSDEAAERYMEMSYQESDE